KTGEPTYSVFGKNSLVFALKNASSQITGLYFRSIENKDDAKHFYLKNRSGIYPDYPSPNTKKLILTESIIDAASLLQIKEITEKYSIVACFGTNGLNDEIQNAIENLKHLEEIILAFDNDDAGNKAVEKYSQELHEKLPKVSISSLELPNKDVNEVLQAHEAEVFEHLI